MNLNDSPSFGGKLTAWHLPRTYNWQPQVGLELDWTRFTADAHTQHVPADGTVTIPGFRLAGLTLSPTDFGVNILAVNLMFRYPIWATPEMPQGRWYPYIGGGVGVEQARLSDYATNHQETDYAPAVQGLVDIKFFLIKNLALFAEWKRTTAWHTFDYNGAPVPLGYSERWTIASNHIVGGIALHF